MKNEISTPIKNALKDVNLYKQLKGYIPEKEKRDQFMITLIGIYESDLNGCNGESVVKAALISAGLNLPINKQLGFSYIVAYKDYRNNTKKAQFQIGYKGLIQLALRTGKYKKMNAIPIYEEQFNVWNPLTEEYEFKFNAKVDYTKKPIGYVAYFETKNGFIKTLYKTYEEIDNHALKYSQSHRAFKNGKAKSSIWNDNFDKMACKTVLKEIISTYGEMSTELNMAFQMDQSEIKEINEVETEIEYIDNNNNNKKNNIPKTKDQKEKAGKEAVQKAKEEKINNLKNENKKEIEEAEVIEKDEIASLFDKK